MLRKYLDDSTNPSILVRDVVEYAATFIERAVAEDNAKPLLELFGTGPELYYLDGATLELAKERIHQDSEKGGADHDDLREMFYTEIIDAAYYYACQQGKLELVSYFTKRLGLPGDLQREVHNISQHFAPKIDLKGPPLKLAVQSGNLELVKYLYENTDALIETCVGDTVEKTLVMLAVEAGNVPILIYLLEHGGNADARKSAFGSSVLDYAIEGKNSFIVKLLVGAGAVVTNHDVHNAITNHLDLDTIKFLLAHSINHEEPSSPYLFAAVRAGNLELVQYFFAHPEFRTMEQCAEFCDLPVTDSLLIAAAGSGNLELMRDLLARPGFQRSVENEKSILLLLKRAASSGSLEMLKFVIDTFHPPLMQVVTSEFAAVEEYYQQHHEDKYFTTSDERFNLVYKSFFYSLVSGSDENKLEALHYMVDELKIVPPQIYLKELCAGTSTSLRVMAYLHTLISEHAADVDLRRIADINVMPLPELFKVFNTRLVQNGSYYKRYDQDHFDTLIKEKIQDRVANQSMTDVVWPLAKDREAFIGALFYYCNDEVDRSADKFMALVSILHKVDQQNCMGDTLASWAVKHRSFKVMEKLLNHGADPDLPNKEGETLMNRLLQFGLDNSRFPVVKEYIRTYTNTLRFASSRSLGGSKEMEAILKYSHGDTGGIPVTELLRNSCQGNMIDKILVLFKYLPRDQANRVVNLLRDETFLASVKIDRYSLSNLFDYMKKVSEKELSAEEREARLRPAPTASAGGLFGDKSVKPSEQATVSQPSKRPPTPASTMG